MFLNGSFKMAPGRCNDKPGELQFLICACGEAFQVKRRWEVNTSRAFWARGPYERLRCHLQHGEVLGSKLMRACES